MRGWTPLWLPGLSPALAAGKPVPVPRPLGTLADGMTPPFVGALPLEIVRARGVEIETVTEEEIADGMRSLVTRAKIVAEGSGAAATAGLLSGRFAVPAESFARSGVSIIVLLDCAARRQFAT